SETTVPNFAVGERAGQREVRNRGLGERSGIYLGGKRARVPSDSVGRRSGERHLWRGVLSARRGDGAFLVADADAKPRNRALREPAWIRLQRVRAQRGRNPLGSNSVRGQRRGGEVHGVEDPQRHEPRAET